MEYTEYSMQSTDILDMQYFCKSIRTERCRYWYTRVLFTSLSRSGSALNPAGTISISSPRLLLLSFFFSLFLLFTSSPLHLLSLSLCPFYPLISPFCCCRRRPAAVSADLALLALVTAPLATSERDDAKRPLSPSPVLHPSRHQAWTFLDKHPCPLSCRYALLFSFSIFFIFIFIFFFLRSVSSSYARLVFTMSSSVADRH